MTDTDNTNPPILTLEHERSYRGLYMFVVAMALAASLFAGMIIGFALDTPGGYIHTTNMDPGEVYVQGEGWVPESFIHDRAGHTP